MKQRNKETEKQRNIETKKQRNIDTKQHRNWEIDEQKMELKIYNLQTDVKRVEKET